MSVATLEVFDAAVLETIKSLRAASETLLLDPGETFEDVFIVAEALDDQLEAWEGLLKAVSTSNPGYEIRDLRSDAKAAHARAKHAITLLLRLHNPNLAA